MAAPIEDLDRLAESTPIPLGDPLSEQPPYQPPPPPPGPPPVPPPPPGGYPPPYAAGPPAGPQNNGKAIAVLVLGILSLPTTCVYGFGVVLAIVALALAPSTKREIAASEGRQTGESMVKAGVICSWIAIGLTILGILVVIVVVVIFAAVDGSSTTSTDTIQSSLTLLRP